MKLLIASDLHGSALYTQRLFEAWDRENIDRLLLLGDLLYHGARNDLPVDYGTMSVAGLLNSRRERLLCVRGNCDSEVDQTVLDFPLQAEYCLLYEGKTLIFATHGHRYNEQTPPPLAGVGVLLTGHTHVPACRSGQKYVYINPGSVSIPKGGSDHSYLTLEDGLFRWKKLDGTQYMEYALNPNEKEG